MTDFGAHQLNKGEVRCSACRERFDPTEHGTAHDEAEGGPLCGACMEPEDTDAYLARHGAKRSDFAPSSSMRSRAEIEAKIAEFRERLAAPRLKQGAVVMIMARIETLEWALGKDDQ